MNNLNVVHYITKKYTIKIKTQMADLKRGIKKNKTNGAFNVC